MMKPRRTCCMPRFGQAQLVGCSVRGDMSSHEARWFDDIIGCVRALVQPRLMVASRCVLENRKVEVS